jgi:catechol 2,3-dioxygenase-like lactoylglutathione lyase family enzyme
MSAWPALFAFASLCSLSGISAEQTQHAAIKPRLGICQMFVTDLEKAKSFYVDTLGFQLAQKQVSGVVTLSLENDPLVLLYPAKTVVHAEYPDKAGTFPVFFIENIESTVAAWNDKKVEFLKIAWSQEKSGIGDCPFGRFIAVRDPFGNVFEILEPSQP